MAVKVLPTVQTIFSGEGVTSEINTLKFELGEKIENTFYVKLGEEIVVDFSKITNLKTFNFYSDDSYTVALTIDVGTEGAPNEIVVPLSVAGTFRLDPSEATTHSIKNIAITTSSTVDVKVSVKVYGSK